MNAFDKKMVRRTWFAIGFLLALAVAIWGPLIYGYLRLLWR